VQNYPYNDIYHVCPDNNDLPQWSVQACIERCDNYGPGCVGILYGVYDQCCYLKSALEDKTPAADAVAYKKISPI
jgi:hypothetical protein